MTDRIDYTALGYSTKTETVTIKVPVSLVIKQHGAKTVYAPVAQFPIAMIEKALCEGLKRVLNDGVGAKAMTDDDKVARQSKRLDAMMSGSWEITERDPAQATLMREAYHLSMLGEGAVLDSKTEAAFNKQMRELVKAQLGDDTNATFDNYLLAMAKRAVANGDKRDADAIKELLVAKWVGEAEKLSASRAQAANAVKIDLTDIGV